MLSNSILGRLYGYWLYSAIYRILRGIYRPFSRAFPNSAVVRFLRRSPKVEVWYGASLFTRIVDAVWNFLLRVFGAVFRFLKPAAGSSVIVRLVSGSVLLSFEVILGAFVFVMFITPHSYWSNSYAVLAAVGLFGLWFLMSEAGRRKKVWPKALGLPFLLFFLACVGSLIFTSALSDSVRILSFFISAFLLCFTVMADTTDERRLVSLMAWIYAAVILTALYAIAQRFMGVEVSASYTDLDLNAGVPGRVYSTLDNPNNYAEFLVLFTPLCVSFAMSRKDPTLRFVLSCCIVFPLAAIVMTYSRSSWLSLAVAAVVFVYYVDKRLIPIGFVAIPLVIPFLPDSIITRLSTIFNSHDSSASHRIRTWQSLLPMLRDHGFTGIGMGPTTFSDLYPSYALTGATKGVYHTQMLYMELFIETGALGFVSFMWLMLRSVKDAAFSLVHCAGRETRGALVGCCASFIGIAVASIFEYIWFYPRVLFAFFILLGICLACIRMCRREKEAPSFER